MNTRWFTKQEKLTLTRMPFQETRYPSFLSTTQKDIQKKISDQSDEAYTNDIDSDSENNDTRIS